MSPALICYYTQDIPTNKTYCYSLSLFCIKVVELEITVMGISITDQLVD